MATMLVVSMFSCGADEDNEVSPEDLVKTWNLVSVDVEVNSTTVSNGETYSSMSEMTGTNPNYTLTMEDATWTTSGGYDIELVTQFNGETFPMQEQSYTNVSGQGSYTADGETITINGSFFSFEVDGVDLTALGDAQTADYEINGNGQLIIKQNETMESNTNGITSSTTMISNSVWEAQ